MVFTEPKKGRVFPWPRRMKTSTLSSSASASCIRLIPRLEWGVLPFDIICAGTFSCLAFCSGNIFGFDVDMDMRKFSCTDLVGLGSHDAMIVEGPGFPDGMEEIYVSLNNGLSRCHGRGEALGFWNTLNWLACESLAMPWSLGGSRLSCSDGILGKLHVP
jgi:hypothetical protein